MFPFPMVHCLVTNGQYQITWFEGMESRPRPPCVGGFRTYCYIRYTTIDYFTIHQYLDLLLCHKYFDSREAYVQHFCG